MAKKLSMAQQWLVDHPDDEPCPRDPNLAGVWRRKRGLEDTASRRKIHAKQAKYDLAIVEKHRPPSSVGMGDRVPKTGTLLSRMLSRQRPVVQLCRCLKGFVQSGALLPCAPPAEPLPSPLSGRRRQGCRG